MIEADKDQNPQNKQEDTTPSTDIPNDKIKVDIKDEKKTGNPNENNQPSKNNPQPFIVKIEKSKGWSKAEIISAFSVIISLSLFFMTLQTFKKTSRAVEISDSTFIANREKDSALNIKSIIRDSLDSIKRERDYIRDSTNKKIAQKSLDAQINSIRQSQEDFELESRPLLQISHITVDSVDLKNSQPPFTLSYIIVNFGKFPAKVISHKVGTGWGYAPTLEQELTIQTIMSYQKLETYYASAYGASSIPYTTSTNYIPIGQYKRFLNGTMFLYLVGEITYESWLNKRRFILSFVYRIKKLTNTLEVTGLKIQDKEI